MGTLSRDYGNYIHALMFTQDYVSAKTEVKLKNKQVTIFIAQLSVKTDLSCCNACILLQFLQEYLTKYKFQDGERITQVWSEFFQEVVKK